MKPEVVLVFGEMGSGKSHYANKLASRNHGFVLVEGDELMPMDMQAAVANFAPVTKSMRERLKIRIKNYVGWPDDYTNRKQGIVVSQALYRDQDRLDLIQYWTDIGFEVTPVWVRVSPVQNVRQLLTRERGLRWVAYWLASKPFFEKPSHYYV